MLKLNLIGFYRLGIALYFVSVSAYRLCRAQCYLVLLTLFFLTACTSGGSSDSEQSQPDSDVALTTFNTVNATAISSASQSEELSALMVDNGLNSAQWVSQFNQAIVSLLKTKKVYLRNTTENYLSLNMLDAWSFATNLSMIYQASDGLTRNELEQFWLDIAGVDGQLNYLETFYSSNNTGVYRSESQLWPQRDHLFKQPFIDWVYSRLKPASISNLDYASNLLAARQTIRTETEFYLSNEAVSAETRLVQVARQIVNQGILEQDSSELIQAVFREAGGQLKKIEAIEYQGNYKQLQRPEGTTTLIPIKNTTLELALIQPEASLYDYYLTVLPAMLREASSLELETGTAFIPVIDPHYSSSDFEPLLASHSVSQIFDKILADLTNLDAGGQYTSAFRHEHMFSFGPEGLVLDSKGVVTTTISPENIFLNDDDGNGGTFGAIFTVGNFIPCTDLATVHVLDPLLLALIDSGTGAIRYLLEVDRINGVDVWACSD